MRHRRSLLPNFGLNLWLVDLDLIVAFVKNGFWLNNYYYFLTGDIPMVRVKMNAKHEYEYIANFKVMQTAFKTKKIDKVRPVR